MPGIEELRKDYAIQTRMGKEAGPTDRDSKYLTGSPSKM